MCIRSTARRRSQKGLTLIELLVAISVLAFVAVIGWRGLDSIVRARITLTSDLENTRGIQLAFAQMQSDSAHLATVILPDREPLAFGAGKLKLVRTVFSENQPTRLQIVTYSVRDGILWRRESPATRDLSLLDAMWQSDEWDTAIPDVALQSGVDALTMRAWVGGAWQAQLGPTAQALPPGTTSSQMPPTGLEVKLRLQGRETSLLKIFLLGAV